MSDYHNVHWVRFYERLLFSAPVYVPVNCFTFDALSRLSDHNADLFFCLGRCFICHFAMHCIEVCPKRGFGMLFCKRLDNPHREWLV
jgi:hypothetical protein